MYPALIVSVVLIVLALMMFFVIPHLTQVLEETEQELPAVTKMVINLTDLFRKWGWVFILIFISLIISAFRYYKTKAGKNFFDKFFLKLPMINQILRMVYLSRFAENLSTLISGGLPITQSLEITGNIVGNSVYQKIILRARDEVRRGEPISQVLSRFPEVFPPVFTQMTLVGERTGTLDRALMNLVNFYQKETDTLIETLLGLLEPLLIVFLGVVVGGLMAAILLPLYRVASF